MAYNREWDRGKDSWNENSWNDGSAGQVHGRDEDYYGEGKRRKFNNGVGLCAASFVRGGFSNGQQGYRNAQPYEAGGFEDYTVARGGHSSSHDYVDDRYQGGHNKKRMVPSEPSPHVIFLGLEPDFTEADVRLYLPSLSAH